MTPSPEDLFLRWVWTTGPFISEIATAQKSMLFFLQLAETLPMCCLFPRQVEVLISSTVFSFLNLPTQSCRVIGVLGGCWCQQVLMLALMAFQWALAQVLQQHGNKESPVDLGEGKPLYLTLFPFHSVFVSRSVSISLHRTDMELGFFPSKTKTGSSQDALERQRVDRRIFLAGVFSQTRRHCRKCLDRLSLP